MYYDINVTLNGKHFFATAPRSVTSVSKLEKVLPIIAKKFPSSEGYDFSVSMREERGQYLTQHDIDNIINNVPPLNADSVNAR